MVDNDMVIKLGMSYFQIQRLKQKLSEKGNIVIIDPQSDYEDYAKILNHRNLSKNISLLETQ